MRHFVVMVFDSYDAAVSVRHGLTCDKGRRTTVAPDTAIVYRGRNGRMRVDRPTGRKGAGSLVGGVIGMFLGLLLPVPSVGVILPVITGVFGAGIGAVGAGVLDTETDRDIVNELGDRVGKGKVALMIVPRQDTVDAVVTDLSGCDGEVVKTSLNPEWESKLRAAMDPSPAGREGTMRHGDPRVNGTVRSARSDSRPS